MFYAFFFLTTLFKKQWSNKGFNSILHTFFMSKCFPVSTTEFNICSQLFFTGFPRPSHNIYILFSLYLLPSLLILLQILKYPPLFILYLKGYTSFIKSNFVNNQYGERKQFTISDVYILSNAHDLQMA